MSLSLKAELEAWANALIAYDAEDFTQALELFEPISDTSRILTNIGLILATIGEHERAVDHFRRATELDSYLAIAYFQGGVSSFLLFNYEEALDQFDNAFMWLRGNQAINYEQIGLNFRLYTAEILFNRGLCLMNLGRGAEGLADLQAAQKEKATPEHDVIADAIRDQGDGYTVFSIPVGVIFRPNPNKIKNLQTKDYLGKARLISKDGSGYRAFDGVDPNELAFRPEDRVPAFKSQKVTGAGANLGRSSSDIGGTSAPKNPAGLARAATAVASVPSRPSMEDRRAPEPLARANTSIRPTRPQSPPEPLARANTSVRSARPVSPPKLRSPEPMSSPVRGLSMRRPPPSSFKATSPVEEPGQIYDSYAARPVPSADEWTERESAHSRTLSRSGTRSQANYMTRSPSQYTVRRALSRKGTMRSRSARSYEEEEGYVSGSGGGDDGEAFEMTKIRVRLHFNDSLRGMAIMPDISCDEFMDQVCSKFGKEYGDLIIKFSDDDGERVTLMDESDFELAIETTRAASLKGKEPRLEIWCETA